MSDSCCKVSNGSDQRSKCQRAKVEVVRIFLTKVNREEEDLVKQARNDRVEVRIPKDEVELADAKAKEEEEATPPSLQKAKNRGDVDQWVKYLDETDPCHRLRSLCKKGDVHELTEYLKGNRDLDLDAVSEEGWTSLHEIITHECQFTQVAEVLLKHGASVNTQDLHGDTPLHSALLYHNADNILLLLRHGADLNLQNAGGRLPIHVTDEVDTLKLMLENGADANAQDRIGNTALHYAVVAKDKARIKALMNHGGKVNLQNKAGSTPLHLVADAEVAQLLLNEGCADPNCPDANGNTPLHIAVRNRRKEIVRLLLEKKSDVGLANGNGKTPLNMAKDKEMKNILIGKAIRTASPASDGDKRLSNGKKQNVEDKIETPTSSPLLPVCQSPSILKRKISEPYEESPRKGPRLRFSDVNDYSGVEFVAETEKRVRVTPVYSEPHFSSDDDIS